MKTVVPKENAVARQFLGVDFVVLAIDNDTMVTKMRYKATDNVPVHKHPNEQSGYVLSGRYTLAFGGQQYPLAAGDSCSISANVKHSIEIIEAEEVVDVCSSIRQDYL